jgi:ribosomal protein S18 acetylase RimI-like enzyme
VRTRQADVHDAATVAALHCACLPAEVCDLTRVGRRIVERFYRNAIARGVATVIVAEDETGIGGFVVITGDVGAMFSRSLLDGPGDILRFLVLADPVGLIRSVLVRLRAGVAGIPDEPELVYLGVDGRCRGRGCGAVLMEAAEAAFLHAGIEHYRLDVHAANSPAVRLYRARGLEVSRRYAKGGQQMLTMTWRRGPGGPTDPAPVGPADRAG